MEYTPVKITLISAEDLKDVHLVSKMKVYAVVTINGDPQTMLKTPVDRNCRCNPKWNYTIKLIVEEAAANQNHLVIRLVSDGHRGPNDVGEVGVPIKEFLDRKEKFFVYKVRLTNGKMKGTLKLRWEIGKKFSVPVAAPPHVTERGTSAETPVMTYPPAWSSAGHPTPPPPAYPYNYSSQFAYRPPPAQWNGVYPPHPGQGYGYTGHPPYGGHWYMPPPQPMAGLGQAPAGSLIGGVYIVSMLSDIFANCTDMLGGWFDF